MFLVKLILSALPNVCLLMKLESNALPNVLMFQYSFGQLHVVVVHIVLWDKKNSQINEYNVYINESFWSR